MPLFGSGAHLKRKAIENPVAPAVFITSCTLTRTGSWALKSEAACIICLNAAVHVTQGPPSAPCHLQLQSDSRPLPSADSEFSGHGMHTFVVAPTTIAYSLDKQFVHAASPEKGLYVPATHSEHTPSSVLKRPATHTQANTEMLPEGEVVY